MHILKNMKLRKYLGILGAVGLTLAFISTQVFASVSPESLSATLAPGESVSETKTVVIPELPAKADIVFCFDLTGSMGSVLAAAQAGALSIMSQLDSTGVDINYGVISHMDYPFYPYGSGSDYPYRLDQALTADNAAVSAVINGLTIGNGMDSPESYTRALYESYSDSNILWRTGTKKIVITFGDNVPHDNNINEGVPGLSGENNTGIDPGRDATAGTADDLDLQTVLGAMAANNVTLLSCQAHGNYLTYWSYWAGLTGGSAYSTESGSLATDVTAAVTSALTVTQVSGLTMKASSGFESWLTSVNPADYSGPAGSTAIFDIIITVPDGTADGVYNFTIDAVDSSNVNYGSQTVSITVLALKPEIQIVKTTNGSDGLYIPVGTPVTWQYVVTNPGNVPLMNVVVSDGMSIMPVYISGDDGDAVLQPGEIWIYEASGTAAAGQYDNIGRADAMSQREVAVFDTDASSYFGSAPAIVIEKTTNGADGSIIAVGKEVTWTYKVFNTGNVDLTGVIVTDTDLGEIGTVPTLLAGTSATLTKTGTAFAGQYENTGTAIGSPPVGSNVTASDNSSYFGAAPGITVVKTVKNVTANGTAGKAVTGTTGDDFLYTIVVTNTGNVDLSDVIITDNKAGVGSYATVNGILTQWSAGTGGISKLKLGSLTPGQTATITYTFDTLAEDLPMVRSNTASVSGVAAYTKSDEVPVTVTAQDSASITTTAVLGAVRAATPTPTPVVLAAAKTGEVSNQIAAISGICLLAAAGGLFIVFRIRRSRKDNSER